jgi:hypothetical protein
MATILFAKTAWNKFKQDWKTLLSNHPYFSSMPPISPKLIDRELQEWNNQGLVAACSEMET